MFLRELSRAEVGKLAKPDSVSYYFLIAAAELNRTTLKKAIATDEAKLLPANLRRAFAIQERLPVRQSFGEITNKAIGLRAGDLDRKSRGSIETLLRERLAAEGIPIHMSPPPRRVPGFVVAWRKPDGVYPDPATGQAPLVYLEVKNVRRVSDDIQKRLYEIAEASLEMKIIYGDLELKGLGINSTKDVIENAAKHRAKIRRRILKARPAVVAFFLCPKEEAERYRAGAETFVDRLFFQEEIEECLTFLRQSIAVGQGPD